MESINDFISVRDPYLKNLKIHDFHESLQKEKNIVSKGDHLKVIHALNLEFEKENTPETWKKKLI